MEFNEVLLAEKRRAESECFIYILGETIKRLNKDDFNGAAAYLENAARSLRALESLKGAGTHERV